LGRDERVSTAHHERGTRVAPSRVLVHLPEPERPILAAEPSTRPARGEEYPPGWTVADYQLQRGEWDGHEYAYEVWVIPLLDS